LPNTKASSKYWAGFEYQSFNGCCIEAMATAAVASGLGFFFLTAFF
jgi:hypothetical protein